MAVRCANPAYFWKKVVEILDSTDPWGSWVNFRHELGTYYEFLLTEDTRNALRAVQTVKQLDRVAHDPRARNGLTTRRIFEALSCEATQTVSLYWYLVDCLGETPADECLELALLYQSATGVSGVDLVGEVLKQHHLYRTFHPYAKETLSRVRTVEGYRDVATALATFIPSAPATPSDLSPVTSAANLYRRRTSLDFSGAISQSASVW